MGSSSGSVFRRAVREGLDFLSSVGFFCGAVARSAACGFLFLNANVGACFLNEKKKTLSEF